MEVQVALIVFLVGVSGLVPLSVVNSKQIGILNQSQPAGEIEYLVPPDGSWDAQARHPAKLTADSPPAKVRPVDRVDDRDQGFLLTDVGVIDWLQLNTTAAYRGRYFRNNNGALGDKATWTFCYLENCRHEVFVTYPPAAIHASLAPYTIYDNGILLARVNVNQRLAPTGPLFDGVRWQSLGVFRIASGTLRVTLTDDSNGYIAADAVRIVPSKNRLELVSVDPQPDQQAITVSVSVTPPP